MPVGVWKYLDECLQVCPQSTNAIGPNVSALPKTVGGRFPRNSQYSDSFPVTYVRVDERNIDEFVITHLQDVALERTQNTSHKTVIPARSRTRFNGMWIIGS